MALAHPSGGPAIEREIQLKVMVLKEGPVANTWAATELDRTKYDMAWANHSGSGDHVTVDFTVSKLPLNTVFRIDVTSLKGGGYFILANPRQPAGVTCTTEAPAVLHYDLQFQPLK